MTLVELLVYMILLGIVVGLIASVVINSLQKQREVVHITQANNTGQTVTSGVDLAVKNAVSFRIVASGDSVLLVTKTRSTATDPNPLDNHNEADIARCIGFYYDSSTQKLHTASDRVSENVITRTHGIKNPGDLASAQNWPVLAEGIQLINPVSGPPVFKKGNDPSKVEIHFMVDTVDDKEPVTFQLTSGTRGSGAIDNKGTC